mgnify:FL=1
MPTWAEFCIVYVAALKAGAVMHPLPRNFNDADLVYGMNLVGSRAFICPTKVAKVDFESQILSIVDQIPTLGPVALVDKAAPKHSELPTVAEICARYENCNPPPPLSRLTT